MTSPRPYQRRRSRPIIATATVLFLLAAATWVVVLVTTSGGPADTTCTPPATGPVPGTVIDRAELDTAAPVAPTDVRFQVLNAGGQRGQANLVSAQLGDLEFKESSSPTNDPQYPDGDMDCLGQLRFGPSGQGAAETLALVMPCVEMVRDDRTGAGVDVVIGAAFSDVAPGRAARDVLDELAAPAGESGRPAVDPAALQQARDNGCT
ncbi:LytR cell envelope-related transcriptional attenuator [Pseudonocardia sediminis]|uniref:LytR cell envelope-related transcriptional attenuator n=1 Tax=Pseudonocardia sediminis TaxID=1397368 RepID=A0A4Q7UUJ6_PSEST|nr:envelope integrity protein Cei [Pseudonocardia sediminis]RZT85425.1 LytR cell envelope-related transcriptional attenuator [Pseudonocardia sediminis]